MLASTALVIASLLSACDTTPVMLHGTVTTAGGSKLNAIQVVVYSNDTDTVIASTATDTSGRYSFHESVLPEGTYRVKIWGQWFTDVTGSGNPQPVTVSAAAPAVADQQFSAVGSLVGSVVNPDGSPVPGVLVSLKDSAGNIVSTNTSGDDGSFSVETPTAGTYTATLVPASNPDNWHDIGGDDATSFAITSGQVFAGPIIVDSGLPYWPNLALNKVDAGLDHTCAIGSGGTVKCWGHNSYGQLGNGTTFVDAYSPVSVVGITDAISVTSGNEYSCALHAGGTISCWGQNPYGQLGNGTYTDSDVPVAVVGITDAVAVSAGYLHTCAVHADGTVSCWGLDLSGALGDGYTSGGTNTPVTVVGIDDATMVTPGYLFTCAVRAGGTISCWGGNSYGVLGDGGNEALSTTPVTVAGINDAKVVSANFQDVCAVRADRTAACWGHNPDGEFGNGTTTDSGTPVTVPNLTGLSDIDTAVTHTCAVRTDGSLFCWGDNASGQLGDGTTTNSLVPVSVQDISDGSDVTTGQSHGCGLRAAGRISCWGLNGYGQLGDGTGVYSSTPVDVVGFGP